MTWALIAHTGVINDGSNPITSSPINTTGADLFVIFAVKQNDVVIAPTDSQSNTWVSCGASVALAFGDVVKGFYVASPTTSSSHTFSMIGVDNPHIVVGAYSGSVASPLDQYNGILDPGVPFQPGSITPTENGELIIACLSGLWGGTPTINSGTITDSQEFSLSPFTYYSLAQAYFVQSTAATVNPTWDNYTDGYNDIGGIIVSFKGSTGGGVEELLGQICI
jgi:hypothetical protein